MKSRANWQWLIRIALFVALVVGLSLRGATSPNGNGSFALGASSDLVNDQRLPNATSSFAFDEGIGGIAFGAVAAPARSSIALVGLRYRAELDDGSRLVATVRDGTTTRDVRVPVPDWQLIPIVKYAAGGQHAVMTLFGTMQDPADDAWMKSGGYDVINLERSFKDTLLGLRLFHADVLILAEASANLPRTSAGYLLGEGEQAPDVASNRLALSELHGALSVYGSQPFQSYVITDRAAGVAFDVSASDLELSGAPYWYCWREVPLSDAERNALFDEASMVGNQELNDEMAADAQALSPEAFDAKYTDAYLHMRFEQLADAYVSPRILEPLPDVSDLISARLVTLGGVNPPVYDALAQTMRLAGLLRLARQVAPGDFADLTSAVAAATALPCLQTPAGYAPGAELILPDEVLRSDAACRAMTGGSGGSSGTGGGGGNAGAIGAGGSSGGASNAGGVASSAGGTTTSGGTVGAGGARASGGVAGSSGMPGSGGARNIDAGSDATSAAGAGGNTGIDPGDGAAGRAPSSTSGMGGASGGAVGVSQSTGGRASAGATAGSAASPSSGGASAGGNATATGGTGGTGMRPPRVVKPLQPMAAAEAPAQDSGCGCVLARHDRELEDATRWRFAIFAALGLWTLRRRRSSR